MSLLDPEDKIFEDALRAQKYRAVREHAKIRIKNGTLCRHCNSWEREQLIQIRGCYEGQIVWDVWLGTLKRVYYVLCISDDFVPEWILVV